jgi:glyoxylase I family protein
MGRSRPHPNTTPPVARSGEAQNGQISALFEVPSIDEVRAIKERLEKAGIEVLGVTDHHFIQSIYFFDPNGLRLEVTARTETEEYMNDAKQKAHASLSEWTATKRSDAGSVA